MRYLYCLLAACLMMGHTVHADDGLLVRGTPPGATLVAEGEADDSYDPFADYSEFQEAADEEEDVNFFKNGRLLTLGFVGGYRGFTGNLGKLYKGGANFGLNLTYFFDLRFALQIGYQTSSHTMGYTDANGSISGTTSYSDISVNLKYYFNTQNVTRGLANLNPYIIAGLSQVYLTTTRSDITDFYGKDAAFGANLGLGIEIPMLRNKMYFGGQAMYNYINLPSEGSFLQHADGTNTNLQMSGDSYTVNFILGANF